MTDIDLDAIEARANAATDGPWLVVHEPAWEADDVQHPDVIKVGAPLYVGDDEPVPICLVSTDYEDDPVDMLGDAEFIAHARTDVPALVAEVRRLRGSFSVIATDQLVRDIDAVIADRDEARAELAGMTRQANELGDIVARDTHVLHRLVQLCEEAERGYAPGRTAALTVEQVRGAISSWRESPS